MIDVIGLGTPFVDYFFEADEEFLKTNGLKPEDDLLFEETKLTPEKIFKDLKQIHKSPGGMSVNTIRALSFMNMKTAYYAVIGKDKEGDYWFENIGNIDASKNPRSGQMSTCACILTHRRKYRTFLSQINKEDEDFFKIANKVFLNSSKHIHIGPFFNLDNKKTMKQLTKLINSISVPTISFTPSVFHANLGLLALSELFKNIKILFLNKNELSMLIEDIPKTACKELLNYGPEIIVCTMGDKGALITTKKEQFFIKSVMPKKIVDTTGAGDTFAAGFLCGYLRKKDLKWSAKFASKAAALSIEGFSLQGLFNYSSNLFD